MPNLNKLWDSLRSGFWFVPTAMILLALLLAVVLVTVDRATQIEGVKVLGALFPKGTQSAGTLLSAIATSILTVAGSIFSIVIVAIQLASGQFGPRMLRDFMQDRVSQVTLGICGATFVYEIAILWAIEDSKDISFTPQVSVFVGLLLAVVSTFGIIYFVHHVAETVHADNLIARIGKDLEKSIDRIFPDEQLGKPRAVQEVFCDFEEKAIALPAKIGGYVQKIDTEKLCAIAAQHDLIFKLVYRPGQFVVENSKFIYACGKADLQPPSLPALIEQTNKTFTCGNQRKPEYDVEFPIRQLVEIAIRAISPAVNDPFTAIRCIDRLTMMLCHVPGRGRQPAYLFDSDKSLRLIVEPVTFETLVNSAFNQIRQYGQTDVSVLIRLLESIEKIGEQCMTQKERKVLLHQANMIERGAQNPDNIPEESDRQDVLQQYKKALCALT